MDMYAQAPLAALRRVAGYWLMVVGILWICAFPRALVPPAWADLVWGAGATLLLCLATRWWSADALQLRAAGEGRTWARLLAGLIVGLALYGANLVLLRVLAGPIDLLPLPAIDWSAVLLVALGILALATMEEIGFRGYPLRLLSASIGFWPAQALVAAAFALAHLLYGWHWLAVVIGVFPSALLFGIAAARSGGLALPIGLHAGLNVARVAAGEREPAILYTLSVSESVQQRLLAIAPALGVLMMLAATVLLWRRYDRR